MHRIVLKLEENFPEEKRGRKRKSQLARAMLNEKKGKQERKHDDDNESYLSTTMIAKKLEKKPKQNCATP